MNTSLFDPFYNSSGISTDTRKIKENSLFVCIKGENFDGNTFAEQALEAGASHVIVDNEAYFLNPDKMTLVDDSVQYLQALANFHRKKFNIPVIGITGSNGKTSTKELIREVLAQKYNVLATEGNLNNHLGVPFTLLRLNESHEIAIIEMGANRFKDIEELCAIAEPTHGIITNIGKAHLEGFGGFEGVLKTKRELYEAVANVNGTLTVNKDDEVLLNALPNGVKTFEYSAVHGNVTGELSGLTPFVKMKWKAGEFESKELETQMIGKYNFYNFLAAISFGVQFDVENEKISEALVNYVPSNNRSQVKKTDKNTLILDCYNANPTSVKSALESFAMNDHPDKIFILGDMLELGKESKSEHEKILQLAKELNLIGFSVGPIYQELKSNQLINQFKSTEDAKSYFISNGLEGKLILLKGSRSIGLEKLEDLF